MESGLLSSLFSKVSRRDLLSKGTALMGGALAGLALQPSSALASEKSKTPESAAGPDPGTAHSSESPNLRPPLADTKSGKVAGFRDGKTYVFLGIPYASADRFELPKPVKPWDGIRNAQVWGPVCPFPEFSEASPLQFEFPHRLWIESEHCQFLNIWTQSLTSGVKKPVMVWFHGGGFTSGSSMNSFACDGKNLSEFGDVVIVSLNHRLNVLGTLDLSAYGPEYANSRYTGTADMVSALEWVQQNIESFGGDPANVTIFGQSGGGTKVVRMMHIPAAKGLFRKVVAESGGELSYRKTDPAASIKTQQMIAAATLKNLSLDASQIDKLKKVSYLDLINAGNGALRSVARETGKRGLAWDVIADDQYVMTEFCDWADSVPLMSGTVFSEMVGTAPEMSGRGKNDWSQEEIDAHLTTAYGDRKTEIVAEFKKNFPRKKIQDVLYYSTARDGVKTTLTRKLEKGTTPVWNYLFTYEYPVNGGVTSFHTSEIVFVFHNVSQPESRLGTGGTKDAFTIQEKMAKAWINFARTGDPSQPGLNWTPYTPQEPQAMVFDIVSEVYPLRDDKLISLMSVHT